MTSDSTVEAVNILVPQVMLGTVFMCRCGPDLRCLYQATHWSRKAEMGPKDPSVPEENPLEEGCKGKEVECWAQKCEHLSVSLKVSENP